MRAENLQISQRLEKSFEEVAPLQDRCNEFWHHPEPAQHARDEGYLSRAGCTWEKISLDLLPSSGGMGTDDTTLSEVVEPSSFDAAGDRLLVHLNCSYSTACGGARTRGETQLPRRGKLKNLTSKPVLISETSGSGK